MSIEFSPYVDSFRVQAYYAKPVGKRLQHAAPHDLSPEETKRLGVVLSLGQEIDGVLSERSGAEGGVREPLLLFIAAFSAMHGSMQATASLPAPESKRPPLAKRILARFFPRGVAFTRLAAPAAWSVGERIVAGLERDGLVDSIAEVTNPDFFPTVKSATTALGDVLGVGEEPRTTPSSTALQQKLADYSGAVAAYARALAAAVDSSDPVSIERFTRAVAPLDDYRASGHASEDAEDSDAPGASNDPATPAPAGPVSPELDPTAPGGPFDDRPFTDEPT
jgi:hypothetical protein